MYEDAPADLRGYLPRHVQPTISDRDMNRIEKTSYFAGWSARQTFSDVSGKS